MQGVVEDDNQIQQMSLSSQENEHIGNECGIEVNK
jgi:hypothetical protein